MFIDSCVWRYINTIYFGNGADTTVWRRRMKNNRVSVYLNLYNYLLFIYSFFLFTSVYIPTRLLHLRYVFISCSNSDKFCLELSSETIERRTFSYVTEILKRFPLTHFTTDRLQLLQISPSNSKLKLNKFHNSHGSLRHYLLSLFHMGKKSKH